MRAAEVQWGVCAGLPSSVFLSEIFEWDQTVIRSKRTQKGARTHTHGTLSAVAAGRGGFRETESSL